MADGAAALFDQLHIQYFLKTMILRGDAVLGDALWNIRFVKNARKIQATSFPVIDGFLHVQQFRMTDHIGQGSEPQLGHDLPQFFSDVEEEVDDMLGLAGELLAKHWILCGYAHWAGVEVALPHHDASGSNQRSGGETKLFSAKQSSDRDIATRLQLTVGLNHNPPAQIVHHQYLLRLSQPKFPRNSCMLDRSEWRSARATIVTADEDNIRVRLGDAGGHGAHSHFGDELHGDARLRVGIFEVVDQLRQIFDRIDVVMRRRGNEAYAGSRMADFGDELVYLVTWQLATFSGLRSLRHLDLQIVGVHQVLGRNTETGRGYLLDGAASPVTILVALISAWILTTFSSVALATDPIHGDGQILVRLLADGAE